MILDISSYCSSPALALFLKIVKNALTIMQIVGPLLCIISLIFTFVQLVSNPDNKKLLPRVKNSIIALFVLFFLPIIVNVSIGLTGNNSINNCWDNSYNVSLNPTYVNIDNREKKKINQDEYERGIKEPEVKGTSDSFNNSSGQVVKKEETNTLKVTIKRIDEYYITEIWVANPYNQLNKYDSPQYGKSLYKPGQLLSKAISKKNLSNKLIVAFNASGFYLRDTYDSSSVEAYSAYDRTSVGTLVITDGKVVRNAYKHAVKTWFIAGVDRNNNLNIYEDAASKNYSAKKEWANNVIGQIRNTFTFASPLVVNGKASNVTKSMPSPSTSKNRQAICQIDTNNFILITGHELSRKKLINIMLSYGCKTGTNFDGGGSIALLFKSKNSKNIDTIIGNKRQLSEVGYFSE